MTKKDLRRYRALKSEIRTLDGYIKKLEREAEKVPTIKDKVQASLDEFPYTRTHVTVDAPAPRQYTKLQRAIVKNKRLKAAALQELLKLDDYIYSVQDERGRTILIEVYINGRSQAAVAIDMDLSYQRVSNIITEVLKKY